MSSLIDDCYFHPFKLIARAKVPALVVVLSALGFGFLISTQLGSLRLHPGYALLVWPIMVGGTVWFAWASMKEAVIYGRVPPPETRFRFSYFLWCLFLMMVPGFIGMVVSLVFQLFLGSAIVALLEPTGSGAEAPMLGIGLGLVLGQIIPLLSMLAIMVIFLTLYGTVLPANILGRGTGLAVAYHRGARQFSWLAKRLILGPMLSHLGLATMVGIVGLSMFGAFFAATVAAGSSPMTGAAPIGVMAPLISFFSSVIGIFLFAQFSAIIARAYWRAEDAIPTDGPAYAPPQEG